MATPSPEAQLRTFLARFAPPVARIAREARARLRRVFPGAVEMVYDNYNALVIGFGPTERASDAIASIAVYPRWVSLFLLRGARLADPAKRLRGSGNQVRHVVLETAATLDEPDVKSLIRAALAAHPTPFDAKARRRTIVKSVSARQRPRRPGAGR
jgi:hypothetical protein